MADEHASIAASMLVARSQRSDGVSAALADRQRTSNMPADIIQASRRDCSDTYDFDMSPTFARRPKANANAAQATFWPDLGLTRLGLSGRYRDSRTPLDTSLRGRRKFHHPIGLRTTELLWITLFPVGCGFQAQHGSRTNAGRYLSAK